MACSLPRNWQQMARADDPYGTSYLARQFTQSGNTCSPRVNGKLVLRSNPYAQRTRETFAQTGFFSAVLSNPYLDTYPSNPAALALYDAVEATQGRFRGKMSKGAASLGVTFASWKQSRDMIHNRLKPVLYILDDRVTRGVRPVPTKFFRSTNRREPLANQVLETEFGWRPLVADLLSAFEILTSGFPAPKFVGVTTRKHGSFIGNHQNRVHLIDYSLRVRTSARMVVSNPNLWLAGHLGFLNPAAVIWDLIPWSFLVNFMSNVNSLVQSFYPHPGVDVSDAYTMRRIKYHQTSYNTQPNFFGYWDGVHETKDRVLGLPKQDWQFRARIPDFSWETVLILSSLLVQRFQKINSLIKIV